MPRRQATLQRIAFAALIAAFTAGPVAAETAPLDARLAKLGYARGEAVDRIHDYRIDAWNYLDDRHIMLYTGVSQRALITTQTDCHELSTAENIGFSTTARDLTKFDKIVVRGAGGIMHQCQIREIHQLDSTRKKSD